MRGWPFKLGDIGISILSFIAQSKIKKRVFLKETSAPNSKSYLNVEYQSQGLKYLNPLHMWQRTFWLTRPTPTPIFSTYSKKTCVLLILLSIVIWHLHLPLICLIHFDKWPLKKLLSYLKKFENCCSFSASNRCLNFDQNIMYM